MHTEQLSYSDTLLLSNIARKYSTVMNYASIAVTTITFQP